MFSCRIQCHRVIGRDCGHHGEPLGYLPLWDTAGSLSTSGFTLQCSVSKQHVSKAWPNCSTGWKHRKQSGRKNYTRLCSKVSFFYDKCFICLVLSTSKCWCWWDNFDIDRRPCDPMMGVKSVQTIIACGHTILMLTFTFPQHRNLHYS